MANALQAVLDYHEATKHQFHQYARGPGYLDWATQPDPFRRYEGSPLILLERPVADETILYDSLMDGTLPPALPLSPLSLSSLLFHSLAISAWKQAGSERWALRVNPSSGNLHPTEAYLICGPLAGIQASPAVFHYAPREHGLELRTVLAAKTWDMLTACLPPGSLLLALSSIHWREAWKYGERAYRYCQLDVGHALGAISVAAAGLGWQTMLMDHLSTDQVAALCGLADSEGPESEHAECLIAIFPADTIPIAQPLPTDLVAQSALADVDWQGRSNRLSRSHVRWEIIEEVSAACKKPATLLEGSPLEGLAILQEEHPARPGSLNALVRRRRSAVSMDGVSTMEGAAFFRMLRRFMPSDRHPPFATLPWSPRAHLAFFVHRVSGLKQGLYFLCRDQGAETALRRSMQDPFLWEKPDDCPAGLPFFLLVDGDMSKIAMQVSCYQDIAGEGSFSVGMIVQYEEVLQRTGAWAYPRLFWECGMIGQVLYLEAEAAGLRGTGIGCFFDDPVHSLLGLEGRIYQDLYHFTVGGPIDDPRLSTLPAYPG
ncbi:MAG: SagB/ThcOx family dehydrogenase [Syntrophobacteraceae bacterium]